MLRGMGPEPDDIDWAALTPTGARVIYVDVDDTLVRSFGAKRIPITAAIARVRALHEAGFELYCWSTGGADYCRATASEIGLSDCFVAFLPKPQILLDDQHPADWRTLRWAHPNSC
jgi:hypothetical protein